MAPDVEDVIYQHPSVREAAVIGVPDQYRGEDRESLCRSQAGFEGRVTQEEIITFCKGRMAAYKYPRLVEFVPEVPKDIDGQVPQKSAK